MNNILHEKLLLTAEWPHTHAIGIGSPTASSNMLPLFNFAQSCVLICWNNRFQLPAMVLPTKPFHHITRVSRHDSPCGHCWKWFLIAVGAFFLWGSVTNTFTNGKSHEVCRAHESVDRDFVESIIWTCVLQASLRPGSLRMNV